MANKPGAKTRRTEILQVRLTAEATRAVRQSASRSCRTASNWIECAILWALKVKAVDEIPRPEVKDEA